MKLGSDSCCDKTLNLSSSKAFAFTLQHCSEKLSGHNKSPWGFLKVGIIVPTPAALYWIGRGWRICFEQTLLKFSVLNEASFRSSDYQPATFCAY